MIEFILAIVAAGVATVVVFIGAGVLSWLLSER